MHITQFCNFICILSFTGELPECARLSGSNEDMAVDDSDLQKALEDSSKEAKKLQQAGKYVSYPGYPFNIPLLNPK